MRDLFSQCTYVHSMYVSVTLRNVNLRSRALTHEDTECAYMPSLVIDRDERCFLTIEEG